MRYHDGAAPPRVPPVEASKHPPVLQLLIPTPALPDRMERVEMCELQRSRPIIRTDTLVRVSSLIEQPADLPRVDGRRVKRLALALMPASRTAEPMV